MGSNIARAEVKIYEKGGSWYGYVLDQEVMPLLIVFAGLHVPHTEQLMKDILGFIRKQIA